MNNTIQEGSLVECLNNKGCWQFTHDRSLHNYGPGYKEISTVDGVKKEDGKKWISLLEYPDIHPLDNDRHWYDSDWFREIQPPMSISESLFNQSTKNIPDDQKNF